MKCVIVKCSGPTVGMDCTDILGVYPDDMPSAQILSEARDYAIEHVSSYMTVMEDEPDEEDGYSYLSDYCYEEDIDYTFEDYNPEIHDMHKAGGGSFKEGFERLCNT